MINFSSDRMPPEFEPPCVAPRTRVVKTVPGDPNPRRFTILRVKKIRRFTIALVKYPDCTNYEGNKILVYERISIASLRATTYLDPHFTKNQASPSPVARFEPTEYGWRLACMLCKHA